MKGKTTDRTEDSGADQEIILREHCDGLEKALKKCTAQLTITKEQLKTANFAKSSFLSHMSHELRTPLNAILGFSRLMHDDTNLTEKQVDNLNLIHQSGELLLNLIDNVLSIAKIDAGLESLEAKTLDLPQFIKRIAGMFNSRAAGHGLTFSLDMMPGIPRFVKCDERKLQQILINVMDNSIKFTDTGEIVLRVWVPESPQGMDKNGESIGLYFELRDTGRGIPPDALETIFDPFCTGSKDDASKTGPGLGLTVSQSFAKMMGGDIIASNRRSKGACVTFHIAVETAVEPAHKDNYRVTGIDSAKTGQRILVVDDDSACRFLISELLNEVGFKVREAVDGEKAVAQFFEWRPHLIFMDIRMPMMDGMVATKIIKATREGRQIPVIALTAHSIDEKRRNILAAGCDGYIRKPFDENELFETIAKHLDLNYIFKGSSQTQSPLEHTAPRDIIKALAQLPKSALQKLNQSSLELDMKKTDDCLDHIQTRNPTLAATLKKLAKRFPFKEINKLTEEALQSISK